MLETIKQLDYQLFHFINTTCSHSFLDAVCPVLRNKFTWIPLYLFLTYFVWEKYGVKTLWIVAFALLTILATDQISSSVIKPFFHRLRPCNNTAIQARLVLAHCSSGFSFVSSHAANHFGIAIFTSYFMGHKMYVALPLLFWAFIISLSQIYVGVHYPTDVLAGAILGLVVGTTLALLTKRVLAKYTL